MKEFGGCLPLERIKANNNPLEQYPGQTFNSGRSAILGALIDNGAWKIKLPYYMCPSVKAFLVTRGIEVEEYRIQEDYMPQVDKMATGEMILWANWYGCMHYDVINRVQEKFGNRLIFDNAQALFYNPCMDFECYYVYSCRKFLGVPSGAYLIQKHIKDRAYTLPKFYSEDWIYLDDGIETGANTQYENFKKNEALMEESFCDMSYLTKEYLKAISWEKIRIKRKRNFGILHDKLKLYNTIDIDFFSDTPYMYPFCVEKEGLRDYLINEKVFVPTWWRHLIEKNELAQEIYLAKNIIPIPIDQRYEEMDMEEIAKCIIRYLRYN